MPKALEDLRKKISSNLSGKTNPKTKKPYTTSEIWAIAQTQFKKMKTKTESKACFLSNIEYKAVEVNGKKQHHIMGFASVPYIDDKDDLIPESLQQKIVDRINNGFANRVSYNHDFFLEGNLLPVASAKAELKKHPKTNKWSTWVDVVLDEDSPKFNDIVGNIDDLNGFSIEYVEDPPSHYEQINDKTVRVFDEVPMFGLGVIGSPMTPVNPMTTKESYEYKAYFGEMKADESTKTEKGEDKMSDEEKPEEKPEGEKKPEGEDTPKEEGKEEETPEEKTEEETAEESSDSSEESPAAEGKAQLDPKDLGEFKTWQKKQEKSKQIAEFKSNFQEAFKAEMKSMPLTQPFMNMAPGEQQFGEQSSFSPELDTWREAIKSPDATIDAKYEAAARLHDALDQGFNGITDRTMNGTGKAMKQRLGMKANWKGLPGREWSVGGKAMQDIQIRGFEYKAQLEHDTNKVDDTDYYQNAAELNDIYDPIIVSHLNDKTTLWGLMKKKNVSNIGSDRYGFRIWRSRIEGIGGSTSAYEYDEGATLTGYHAAMLKLAIPFMQYGVTLQVSGLMVAEARGSLGDIFAKEVQRGTADLGRGINLDLYGTSYGMTVGGKILGLKVLGDDGGEYANLYGRPRGTYTTLQGTDDSQSGNIDKPLLRKAIRTPEKNGAPRSQMIYVMDQIQRDKILGLLDPAQRFNNTSARAGFEGLPMFDNIPIHSDDQCDDGFIYALPMNSYYAAVLQAPTFEDLAKTDDSKKGFVKTYFAVVCENPNWVYKITGLDTS